MWAQSKISAEHLLYFFYIINIPDNIPHVELFNSQGDHKRAYISAKVCQVLLGYTSFPIWRQKCVYENWSWTKWGSTCKVTEKSVFIMLSYWRIRAMGIVSVDQIVLRHLLFANYISKFIIHDYWTLGSPFLVTTLRLTIPYWRSTLQNT